MTLKTSDVAQPLHSNDQIEIQKVLTLFNQNFSNVDRALRFFLATVPDEGTVILGKVSSPKAGQLQWNGTKFQGWTGSAWVDLN